MNTTMKTVRTVSELRRAVAAARAGGVPVGLVPTMGSLHEGHLSLVRKAAADCGFVVVSLFVNPSQFGPGEDYERYPRDEQRDAELARTAGADLLFAPTTLEMYPDGFTTTVSVAGVADVLCGSPASRGASHFDGVATVVVKLLNMCAPDVAYFGQKDYQQSLVIRRAARDLDLPTRIEVCPTVRDPDGLALSSRNAYLSREDRERALALNRSLRAAEQVAAAGGAREDVLHAARAELDAAAIEPEYLEILSAGDLSTPSWGPGEQVVLALAAQVGPARLIDNTLIQLPVRNPEPAVAG
jgi:pantoate--beta-alanine ligase